MITHHLNEHDFGTIANALIRAARQDRENAETIRLDDTGSLSADAKRLLAGQFVRQADDAARLHDLIETCCGITVSTEFSDEDDE